jgi:hypothetical protein
VADEGAPAAPAASGAPAVSDGPAPDWFTFVLPAVGAPPSSTPLLPPALLLLGVSLLPQA